jgi:hypothetical protein
LVPFGEAEEVMGVGASTELARILEAGDSSKYSLINPPAGSVKQDIHRPGLPQAKSMFPTWRIAIDTAESGFRRLWPLRGGARTGRDDFNPYFQADCRREYGLYGNGPGGR